MSLDPLVVLWKVCFKLSKLDFNVRHALRSRATRRDKDITGVRYSILRFYFTVLSSKFRNKVKISWQKLTQIKWKLASGSPKTGGEKISHVTLWRTGLKPHDRTLALDITSHVHPSFLRLTWLASHSLEFMMWLIFALCSQQMLVCCGTSEASIGAAVPNSTRCGGKLRSTHLNKTSGSAHQLHAVFFFF